MVLHSFSFVILRKSQFMHDKTDKMNFDCLNDLLENTLWTNMFVTRIVSHELFMWSLV